MGMPKQTYNASLLMQPTTMLFSSSSALEHLAASSQVCVCVCVCV